jgi:hypothetical protein
MTSMLSGHHNDMFVSPADRHSAMFPHFSTHQDLARLLLAPSNKSVDIRRFDVCFK